MIDTLHEGQHPPEWSMWGMSAWHGAGKTYAALTYIDKFMRENLGARGLIVVPTAADVRPLAELLTSFAPTVEYRPSVRRLSWGSERSTIRLEDSREALARVQDLPDRNRTRRLAEVEYDEALREARAAGSVVFITSSEEPDSIRGVQSHITLLDSLHDFRPARSPEYLSAEDSARIATRLGVQPKLIVTHVPGFKPKFYDEITYTMDSAPF